MQGNRDKPAIQFDSEIERTLRELRKQAKIQQQQAAQENLVFEEEDQISMADEEPNDARRTLGDYTIPSTASCGSSIVIEDHLREIEEKEDEEKRKSLKNYT
ncbi:hypothetical protein PIB30_096872, partial [Stylosanthes scabra]|nr:hypothetical protein [Stylosanthes scabra]